MRRVRLKNREEMRDSRRIWSRPHYASQGQRVLSKICKMQEKKNMGCKRFNRGVSVEKNSAVPLKKEMGMPEVPGFLG